MLLNEFYNPSNTDLKLLALIVLGQGKLTLDTIEGDLQLQTALKRLINLNIVVVVNDVVVLTSSGKSVSVLGGVSDPQGTPTKLAYDKTDQASS